MENKDKEIKEITAPKNDESSSNLPLPSKDVSTLIVKKVPEQVSSDKVIDSLKSPTIVSNNSSLGSKELIKSNDGIKINFTPSSDAPPILVVKKAPEQVSFDKVTDSPKTLTAASINSSLGSFANDAYDPSKEIKQELKDNESIDKKLIVKKEEPIAEAEINFEKFQTKQKTSFGVKVNMLLNNKKALLKIWISIFIILGFLIGTQITYIVFCQNVMNNHGSTGPGNFSWFNRVVMTGYIFSFIATLLPIIPFFFLLTSWIVGINGVHASKTFHYFLWLVLLISIICFIVSTVLVSYSLGQYYAWTPNR